ncbi:class I adenylate-forming enzyme family protein [Nocardia brasiliensis]|uniref:class I adenylate-forming enzyme family protein n=1 Tax=Nocardia brasiliensis TaxID=37326 RepID=UPI00189543C0|nr:class I adenylate-forming enzyme family protein [Nocardia brasiliensis]MBF6548230.1 acyl--CoA ligase [Nocardia brasiliensis]
MSTVTDAHAARPVPDFLRVYAPSRFQKRISPVSRIPATGRIGEVWHAAAQRGSLNTITVDRVPDLAPEFGTILNYGNCATIVDHLAAKLNAWGVRPWDRVAVVKRNHLDTAFLASAIARLGAIPALISDNHSREVLDILIGRLETPFLVTDAGAVDRMGIDTELVAKTVRTACVGRPDDRPDLDDWFALDEGIVPENAMRQPFEPMVITHTSGTTGAPKLVMHSANSLYSLALGEAERWPGVGLRATDRFAICEPYCHQRVITGLLAMATVQPTMLCLSDPMDPAVRDALVAYRPTFMETVPNGFLYWEKYIDDPGRPFADVRVYVSSYDGIHTRTMRKFLNASKRRQPLWLQSWSQSEAGPVAVRVYVRHSVRRVGHRPPPTQVLGWAVPRWGKVRCVDPETGRPVPRGQVGLIQLSAPGRCLAYVNEQDRHTHKVDGEWWDLGDLGIVSRWGTVRMIDREIDRLPESSTIELEDVLLDRLPETTEVIVLAIAGGPPQPVLSIDGDRELDRNAWRAATHDMPELAEPIQVKWSEFPRTATWKVRRVALRKQLFGAAEAIGKGRWT